MRKTKRYLIVLVVLLAVTVAALIVVPNFIDINRYRPAITDLLSRHLNRMVTINGLRLTLITGPGVIADGVTIAEVHRPDHPLVTASELKVVVGVLPLLKGDLEIRRLVLKEPKITLVRYSDGSLSTDGLGMTAQPGGPSRPPSIHLWGARSIEIAEVSIRSISVRDGMFTYLKEAADGQTVRPVSLAGLDLDADSIVIPTETSPKTGAFLSNVGADFSARIKSGTIGSIPFSRLSLVGVVKDGVVTIRTLRSALFGGDLSADGKIPLLAGAPNGTLTLSLAGANANELLNAFSSQKDALSGTLDFTGDYTFPITGFSNGLTGGGKVTLKDGYFRDFSLRDELAKSIRIPTEALPSALDTGAYRLIGCDYLIRLGKVTANNLAVDGTAFTAAGAGYVGFDKSIDISGTITLREVAVISSLYSDALSLVGLSSRIGSFPFRVSGTLDRAEFSIPFLSAGVERGVGNVLKSLEGDILR